MKLALISSQRRAQRARAFSLVELMVSVVLSSILLAMAGSLWLFGSRSFAALGNYADLDSKSRTALDQMSRDIRRATQVTACRSTSTAKWFTVTNAISGTSATYIWKAATKTLACQQAGQPDRVYLTECDRWDFDFFQRTPQLAGGYVFFPATNSAGAYDLSLCKLINMSWKCSRTVLGNAVNTESVQTAQVVLRNKQ